MIPKFRLEDANAQSDTDNPGMESCVKIMHTDKSMPRCDAGGPCYGCSAAEFKQTQEDMK